MKERPNRHTKIAFGSGSWQYDAGKVDNTDTTITHTKSHLANLSIADSALARQDNKVPIPEETSALISSPAEGGRRSRCVPRRIDPWSLYKPLLSLPPKVIVARPRQRQTGGRHRAIVTVSENAKPDYVRLIDLFGEDLSGPMVDLVEVFDWKGKLFLVTEFIDNSLTVIRNCQMACELLLSEAQLSYMIGQV